MTSGLARNWIVGTLEAGFRALVRLAPAAQRPAWQRDAIPTFRLICFTAYDHGGSLSLIRAGLRELVDLFRVVIGLRFRTGRPADMRALDPGRPPDPQSGDRRHAPGVRAWRDVRLAWLSLRASGVGGAIAVATLALGIGVNAAIFSVLDSVLFRPVPFRDAARLVALVNFAEARGFSYAGFTPAAVTSWNDQTDLFGAVEAYAPRSFVFDNGTGAEMVSGAFVTPGLFRMLGVEAADGRTFTMEEGRGGTSERAVVSDGFWRQRLGGASGAIGREIRLDGRRLTIVGVMPATFRFPSGSEEVWLPYDVMQAPAGVPAPALTPVARLADGVPYDRAAAEVRARGERVNRMAGGPPDVTAQLERTGADVDQRTTRSLWVLCGAVGSLFLIVCANVANLSLSRSLSRARDLATCAALGATPAELVRLTIVEQVLLAGAGAAGALVVATLALHAAVASLPDAMTDRTLNPIVLNLRTWIFLLTAGLVAALLFGVAPAVMAARTSVAATLGAGGRASTGTRLSRRFRATLAVVEVAVSVILLVGSALMARSFVKLATTDPGFDTRNLISIRIGFPRVGYADARVRDHAALDLVDRLQHAGGVTGATVGGLPAELSSVVYGTFEFAHEQNAPEPIIVPLREVPPSYFATLGLPIRAGRGLQSDDAGANVVVNERFAAKFFRTSGAVGGRFRVNGGPWRTIVGIAGNTDTGTDDPASRPEIYAPIGGATDALVPSAIGSTIAAYRTFLVRAPHPDASLPSVVAAVHGYDRSLIIWKTALVDRLLADAIARPRVVFLMMTVFAAVGLVLATAGLYGVLSCLVAQRRREIGVRLALGASPRQMRWLVLGSGLVLTGAGLAIGLGAAVPLVRLMRSLLYEVDPMDPVAIAGSTILLGATALFACWWPAKDAMRVDPVELLRGE